MKEAADWLEEYRRFWEESFDRLDEYLRHFGARRLVHGHTPHFAAQPVALHGGRVMGFDGRFSRYWSRGSGDESGPIGATVALLPPVTGT